MNLHNPAVTAFCNPICFEYREVLPNVEQGHCICNWTALLTWILPSFLGPAQLFIVHSVWSCSVKMSSAHLFCSTCNCSSSASPEGIYIDLQGWKSRTVLVSNETQAASRKPACQKPACWKSTCWKTAIALSHSNRRDLETAACFLLLGVITLYLVLTLPGVYVLLLKLLPLLIGIL